MIKHEQKTREAQNGQISTKKSKAQNGQISTKKSKAKNGQIQTQKSEAQNGENFLDPIAFVCGLMFCWFWFLF